MKKNLITKNWLFLFLFFALLSCNKEETALPNERSQYSISKEAAQKIAGRFSKEMLHNAFSTSKSATRETPQFPYREHDILNSITVDDKNGVPALYIFNYASDSGFVVISADIRYQPICAFVDHGNVTDQEVPSMLLNWFDKTIENIEIVREERYDNTERANDAWYYLLQETNLLNEIEVETGTGFKRAEPHTPSGGVGEPGSNCDGPYSTVTRGPLLPVRWGQGCTFNEQCPSKSCTTVCGTNQNAWTGCVATSMSQILRYWQNSNQFNYNYASMPATSGNAEVQRMMRDAGNSISMDYGCSGSGANSNDVVPALKNTFGYGSATRSSYNVGSYQTVTSDISANRPVILDGCSDRKRIWGIGYANSSCHSWICDGYMSTSNNCYSYLYLHMNWGWHTFGNNNDFVGYYAFDNWNVSGMKFQYGQDFIHNIHP